MRGKILLTCAALLLLGACKESGYNDHKTTINEPSGAGMSNAPVNTQERDIYQRPYPGRSPMGGYETRDQPIVPATPGAPGTPAGTPEPAKP